MDMVAKVSQVKNAFAGRIAGVPSLWPRPGGVLQPHGDGVFHPGGLLPSWERSGSNTETMHLLVRSVKRLKDECFVLFLLTSAPWIFLIQK